MKNGYDLTRTWFDFAFETGQAKCTHTALYLWLVELNNRLGWKQNFGLPTYDTMESLGITNRRTYFKALHELEEWGFIIVLQRAKNMHTATIISLPVKEHKKGEHALDHSLRRSGPAGKPADSTAEPEHVFEKEQIAQPDAYPTKEEVRKYFAENLYNGFAASKFYEYYSAGNWKDRKGRPLANWKQTAIAAWFKPEYEMPKYEPPPIPIYKREANN